MIHVSGLWLVYRIAVRSQRRHDSLPRFAIVLGATVLLATALHGLVGLLWATAYLALNAIPDFASAMLYSVSAMTSYGHVNLYLAERWQMMGALEALNGMLLFGLTTAFLFSAIQRVLPLRDEERSRSR